MIVIHVVTGDTMSAIAAAHAVPLSSLEAANRATVPDPNRIYVGEKIVIPSGGSWAPAPSHGDGDHDGDDGFAGPPESSASPSSVPSVRSQAPAPSQPSGNDRTPNTQPQSASTGGLADVPGVPSAFAACVAYRESTNLQNPAARGNAYGIIPASGYNGYAMSLSQQKATFAKLYAQYGSRPWVADGCPQTLYHQGSASDIQGNPNRPTHG